MVCTSWPQGLLLPSSTSSFTLLLLFPGLLSEPQRPPLLLGLRAPVTVSEPECDGLRPVVFCLVTSLCLGRQLTTDPRMDWPCVARGRRSCSWTRASLMQCRGHLVVFCINKRSHKVWGTQAPATQSSPTIEESCVCVCSCVFVWIGVVCGVGCVLLLHS